MSITQQKLPPKQLIKELSSATLNSIVGNFDKYIREGSCVPVIDAKKYSIMTAKEFLIFWETITDKESNKIIELLHDWMEDKPHLPKKHESKNGLTIENSLINEHAPIVRHFHKFNDKFDSIHESILHIFGSNYSSIKKGAYFILDDIIVFIVDIKNNPKWNPFAKRLIDFIVFSKSNIIGNTLDCKKHSVDKSLVCIDIVNESPTIKLCYEVEQQNENTQWWVGSIMENNYSVIESYKTEPSKFHEKKQFYNENHTLIAYINKQNNNYILTENTEIDSDEQHICLRLSNAYPINHNIVHEIHIGKMLSNILIKKDPRNKQLQKWFYDNVTLLFDEPTFPLYQTLNEKISE